MYSLEELFENKNWYGLHDTLVELFEVSPTKEQVRTIFNQLPEHIQECGLEWGLNDTDFCTQAYQYIKDNCISLS